MPAELQHGLYHKAQAVVYSHMGPVQDILVGTDTVVHLYSMTCSRLFVQTYAWIQPN